MRARGSAAGPSVVWIRKGNTRRVDLLIWLERLLPSIEAAVQSGERVIELH
jgi:predicted nuclease of predicted toxin-antitoxin system